MRLLVTGSRDWKKKGIVKRVLISEASSLKKPITLVSGACPSGADKFAEEVAALYGWEVERHPADWDRYGKRAGPVRNREMVDLGADVCVAFILNGSRGAASTADLAEKAGIITLRIIDRGM